MKIYLLEKEDIAIKLAQLLKLNGECAKLHWSRNIKAPNNVVGALETIESFIEATVYESCSSNNEIGELTDDEEAMLMSTIRKNPELKDTLGTGVVLAGEQNKKVREALKGKTVPNVLDKALDSGKHIIIF